MGKIIVPEIWIPKYKDVGVEAGIGVWGELEWQLIDKGNFLRPTVVRKGKQRNLIVNAGLNGSKGLVGNINYYNYMDIGKGTAEPSTADTALVDSVLSARKSHQAQYSPAPVTGNPSLAYTRCVFQFNEDEANDDLTEWGTFYSTTGAMWCRELFRDENGNPVVITKTSSQVLVLTYNCYWQRGSDNPAEATFNVDGTNYAFATLINNNQLLRCPFMPDGPYTIAGTSNTPSNVTDVFKNLKGTSLGSSSSTSVLSYVADSFVCETKLTVDTNKWNGNIGEIIWSYSGGVDNCVARTTITPVFPKTSSQKLYITFRRTTVRV
jgi:hypothetical protein